MIPGEDSGKKWARIAHVIMRRLNDGTYPTVGSMPSYTEIASELGEPRSTVYRAIKELEREGILHKERKLPADAAFSTRDDIDLTPRERDVLRILCRVNDRLVFSVPPSAEHIAKELRVSDAAVKQILLKLYAKFDIPEGPDRRLRLANRVLRDYRHVLFFDEYLAAHRLLAQEYPHRFREFLAKVIAAKAERRRDGNDAG